MSILNEKFHTIGNQNFNEGSNLTITLSASDVDNEITLGDSNFATLRCNTQTISSLSD